MRGDLERAFQAVAAATGDLAFALVTGRVTRRRLIVNRDRAREAATLLNKITVNQGDDP